MFVFIRVRQSYFPEAQEVILVCSHAEQLQRVIVLVIVADMVRAFGTVNAKISEKFLLFSGTTIRGKNIKCASGHRIMCWKNGTTRSFHVFVLPQPAMSTRKWTLVRAPIIMKSIIIKINWCKFKEKEAEELLFHKNKYKSTVEKKEKKKTPAWKTTNVSWVEIQCVKVIFRALAYIRSHRHIKMSIFTLSWVTRWNLSIEKDLLCLHDAQVKRAANPTGAILMRKFSHFYSTRLNVKNKKSACHFLYNAYYCW